MVAEIHRAAIIGTLTNPVAANQLATSAIFSVKMTPLDLTSPVADRYLAAGAFFLRKLPPLDLTRTDTDRYGHGSTRIDIDTDQS